MNNLTKQLDKLRISAHFKWEEETETITIQLKDYNIVCKAECTFNFEDGELSGHGIAKQVFSDIDSKSITVINIYSNKEFTDIQKFEVEKILNNKLWNY